VVFRFSIIVILVISLYPLSSATIINIPADYPTIQQGIDASVNGDTVLVQPGTYVENINFNGHNIVLGSLFLTTGDTSYISQTVIDGDGWGTVVSFENGEDSTAIISGFTIQNGYVYWNGGGIYCGSSSSPTISNNIITRNYASEGGSGGGICCENNSNPKIVNNTISANGGDYGGGIYCSQNSNPEIYNNIISGNYGGYYGGGIFCGNSSSPTIINNTITENTASWIGGGGLCCLMNSSPIITNNIFWADSAQQGSEIYVDGTSSPMITYCDIQGGWQGQGNIDSDPQFVYPHIGVYNICAQSPCIDAGDPDIQDPDSTRSDIGVFFPDHRECEMGNIWYVSVTGNDTTGNGSLENPFRTIQHTIDISYHRDSIIVENGTYIENINIFKYIVLASRYMFTGDSLDIYNTIIDGRNLNPVMTFDRCEDNMVLLEGFTITDGRNSGIHCYRSDPVLRNNIIYDNSADSGGGVFCMFSNPLISNNSIQNNSADQGGGIYCIVSFPIIHDNYINSNSADLGGGIYCWHASPDIINNVISGNFADLEGGGIYCEYSAPHIINNIIIENSASGSSYSAGGGIYCWYSGPIITNTTISNNIALYKGGGIYCRYNSDPIITNSILWGDSAQIGNEIYVNGGSFVISYSDIQGGWPGVGNIDIDPLFRDPANGDFHLMSTVCEDPYDSPCIDAGDPNILDSLLDCSWGLGGPRSDMGAYGGGDSAIVGIFDNIPSIPDRFILLQNYPNPFNAQTTIRFVLPEDSNVRVALYDILGRKLETLFAGAKPAGRYSISWDASTYPSGIYFARLETKNATKSIKMLLLK